jgi:hypothetical protein
MKVITNVYKTIIVSEPENPKVIRGEDSPICKEKFLHPLDEVMYEEQMEMAEDQYQSMLEEQHDACLEETYQESEKKNIKYLKIN